MHDLIWQMAMEHETTILSGEVASEHIHILVGYGPHMDVSRIVPVAERDQLWEDFSIERLVDLC